MVLAYVPSPADQNHCQREARRDEFRTSLQVGFVLFGSSSTCLGTIKKFPDPDFHRELGHVHAPMAPQRVWQHVPPSTVVFVCAS